MAKKLPTTLVEGKELNANDLRVYNKFMEMGGEAYPSDVAKELGLETPSVRATMARIEKVHGLIKIDEPQRSERMYRKTRNN